jgi:hypothetical protein
LSDDEPSLSFDDTLAELQGQDEVKLDLEGLSGAAL